MSVSLLFGLLPYWNHTNICYSSSGWDIFLKFLGDTLRTLIHYFQIILNFLYVCQSVSWLTSLLKLDKYRHISGPEWDIFLKIFGDIPGMLLHHFQIILNFLYVCQSVSWLTSLLKLTNVGIYIKFWMRYLSDIFWRHYGDCFTLFHNNFRFLVYLSVCVLPFFLSEVRYIKWYCNKKGNLQIVLQKDSVTNTHIYR